MKALSGGRGRGGRRGTSLVIALVILLILMSLAAVVVQSARSAKRSTRASMSEARSQYTAESGLSDSIADVAAGGPGDVGSAAAPVPFSGGGYWVDATDNGDETWLLVSRGVQDHGACALEAVLSTPIGDLYRYAAFAGNSTNDPSYALEFAGTVPQNDVIDGDVYSGGDLLISADAVVTGRKRATGAIVGATGQTGISLPIPDVAAMNDAANNDVDVAAEFALATLQLALPYGGLAWQVPQTSPAHIFRRNPADRAVYTALTAKDDYFLEDPYAPFGPDLLSNGTSAAQITLSGVGGALGPSGNDLIYFIDGNLWVLNLLTNSFKLEDPGGGGLRATIVVRGNLYLGDNLFYDDPALDGLAFIALSDPLVPDSGNVYMGDLLDGTPSPILGALRHVDGFMHAERDFWDNNLDHLGLGRVEIYGNQTAAGAVNYKRSLLILRSKLELTQDRRVKNGTLTLPGLPAAIQRPEDFSLLSWRRTSFN